MCNFRIGIQHQMILGDQSDEMGQAGMVKLREGRDSTGFGGVT